MAKIEMLNDYEEQLQRYVDEETKLTSSLKFCREHNFAEEERITRVKYDAINMLIYRWKSMHKEIQDLLNQWRA